MREHSFYFKGIGSYNPATGETSYHIIMPKIEGVNFKFHTDNLERISYQGKDCLMIYTNNGVDDENYGVTPEIVQIDFKINNIEEYQGKEINIIINHDADMESHRSRDPREGRKPGMLGLGTIRP